MLPSGYVIGSQPDGPRPRIPTVGTRGQIHSNLVLPRNELSGPLPTAITNGLTSVYRIDLGSNKLSGPLPHLGEKTPLLRFPPPPGNHFSGETEAQMRGFADLQKVNVNTCASRPILTYARWCAGSDNLNDTVKNEDSGPTSAER